MLCFYYKNYKINFDFIFNSLSLKEIYKIDFSSIKKKFCVTDCTKFNAPVSATYPFS